uniref:Uncharacterized protein n=1 Tax=Arundo donax TaxID=35708 RepID=A0A0A9E6X4_ARUDO
MLRIMLQKSFTAMILTVCLMLTEEISKLILKTAQFQRTVLKK